MTPFFPSKWTNGYEQSSYIDLFYIWRDVRETQRPTLAHNDVVFSHSKFSRNVLKFVSRIELNFINQTDCVVYI